LSDAKSLSRKPLSLLQLILTPVAVKHKLDFQSSISAHPKKWWQLGSF